MKLGLFMMPLHNFGRPYGEVLAEDIEAALYAEELGFDEFWCGEHYTTSVEQIPSPLMLLSYLAARTRTIKLGTGVACMPHYHPAVIGSDAAFLDHLSNGRFIFGVGPGGLSSDFELMGTLDADRPAMVLDSVDMIHKIWAGDPPYDIQGKFWSMTVKEHVHPDIGLGTLLKPLQAGGPPIAISAASPYSGTMKTAGARGWIPVTANFIAEWSAATHWPMYEAGAKSAGRTAERGLWHVARSIHVADSDAEAEAYVKRPGGTFDWYFDYLWRIYDRGDTKAMVVCNEGDDPAAVTHEMMRDAFPVYGSPETVVRKLLAFREKTGDFGTLLMTAHDWQDKAVMKHSMELMAKEVMPALNAATLAEKSKLAAA